MADESKTFAGWTCAKCGATGLNSVLNIGGKDYCLACMLPQWVPPSQEPTEPIYIPASMSLRDYFAAHAPALEIQYVQRDHLDRGPITLYEARYIWADAMIKAREDTRG